MPLTARLRDEENERINNTLKRLIALDDVPDAGNGAVDEILDEIGLSFEILLSLNPDNLILYMKESRFDCENAEQLADFLVSLSDRNLSFKEKAIAVYNYIQMESKTFSFGISNKIAGTKK